MSNSNLKLIRTAPQGSAASEEITLDGRQTEELIFAFVGPVGSGVTYTAELMLKKMIETFGYEGHIRKLSGIITEDASKVGQPSSFKSAIERIETLQVTGNLLREKYGVDYLSRRIIEKINEDRALGASSADDINHLKAHAQPRRYVTIIDSIKRPEEIELLKRVYGDLLHVFCVFAPEEKRRKRLGQGRFKDSEIDKVFEIDENEGSNYGQRVRDTSHLADFFIRNDRDNDEELGKSVDRFLEIIFSTQVHTPQIDETAMYAAIAAARGSACLSRQVGAVIYTKDGEQIGQGCNDVPKFGGGLYGEIDGGNDHRCFKWGGKRCHNDHQKADRYDEILNSLEAAGVLVLEKREVARSAVAATRLKDLIEFSRAVHAEMEAIISVARNGNAGLVGATLYCTTFPCHNCARHIIASGIARVVYIEPYAKSLASVLHDDAIKFAEGEGDGVLFQQYQGVAPRNIDRLFSVRGERKRDGKLFERVAREALPVCAGPLDGIAIRETLVISETSGGELKAGENASG